MSNNAKERAVLDAGLAQLRELVGTDWKIEEEPAGAGDASSVQPYAVVTICGPNGMTGVVVFEAKTSLTPAQASDLIPRLALAKQTTQAEGVVVITSWLSPQARDVLTAQSYGYLDLSGNVSVRLSKPGVFIQTRGADRNPAPKVRGERGLIGPRAGRLVRALVDVAPPYRASDLAQYSNVSLPYVSRLLDVMERRALVTREGRVVADVDWVGLLRARAGESKLLRANSYVAMLAPQGLDAALARLRNDQTFVDATAITGSVAAKAIAPITVGGQLMIYVAPGPHEPDRIGKAMGLLRSDSGDILLLRAADPVVFARTRPMDGLRHVALSQLAVDCLTGTGRMPAEGEAIIDHMIAGVGRWRLGALESASPSA